MGDTIDDLLRTARSHLAATPFGAPPREAYLLLGDLLGLSEAQLIARGDLKVPEDCAKLFSHRLQRRLQGEPVAYLLGWREFFGRRFRVDDRVLIPRPETEHLIEAALQVSGHPPSRILDVGTGSGCLAITLALELPNARITASDLSLSSLALAARNVHEHGVGGRVRLVQGDLTEAISLRAFDLVISNPPYIDPADREQLSPEIREFEPPDALFAQDRGLALFQRLLERAKELPPESALMIEIGFGQLEEIRTRATDLGLCISDQISDYAGIPRTLVLRRVP
ncbi:MAG: peptide chain release factor N(5)-glutamine methyltransferase [Deltaproteobacteria bacterium]|nr:peptide chain release factor N(5)-glutamine methyltransferase [Deltaproteobacteria bacterium]